MIMKEIEKGTSENKEAAIRDHEMESVVTEVAELRDGTEYLTAECPFCGYAAMVERNRLDSPEADVDGCKHLVEIEESCFFFKRVNRLVICVRDEKRDCVPPKAKSGRSMWGIKEEAKRAKLLREKAYEELCRQNMKTASSEMRLARALGLRSVKEMAENDLEMLVGKIGIAIRIYIPEGRRIKGFGNLNSHVSGTIGAMSAANVRMADSSFDACFGKDREDPVYPKNPILFLDDSQIKSINASFYEIASSERAYYEVELTFIR